MTTSTVRYNTRVGGRLGWARQGLIGGKVLYQYSSTVTNKQAHILDSTRRPDRNMDTQAHRHTDTQTHIYIYKYMCTHNEKKMGRGEREAGEGRGGIRGPGIRGPAGGGGGGGG